MESAIALNVIVDNLVEATEHFSGVAAGEGLAPLLVLAGMLLIVFSMGVFGVLSLGAVASLFSSS